jgi:DNA-binding transcriptional MerR regulator
MQEMEEIVTIGEVSKALGLTTRTLRYWEEVGIIESVARSGGSNRGYTQYTVRRIKFIMRLKDFGLTIKEMQDLYKVYGEAKHTDRMIPELVRILEMHVGMIDDKMATLLALRTEITDYCHKIQDKFNASKK